MRSRVLARSLLVAALLLVTAGGAVLGWDQCVTYSNSHPDWLEGYGGVCMGTGSGCAECSNADGVWCVDAQGGDVCRGYPEYQCP